METKQDDLSKNQKLKILICIVPMTFISCIDGSIVNVLNMSTFKADMFLIIYPLMLL